MSSDARQRHIRARAIQIYWESHIPSSCGTDGGGRFSQTILRELDLTPIHTILWKDLHTEGPGRPVEYQPEWDLKTLMLRQLLKIPYFKDWVKRLKRNPYLRQACGYGDRAPTEAHFTQMKKRIGTNDFHIMEAWLR